LAQTKEEIYALPQVLAKTFPYFSMVHLLHRLYGVDATVIDSCRSSSGVGHNAYNTVVCRSHFREEDFMSDANVHGEKNLKNYCVALRKAAY